MGKAVSAFHSESAGGQRRIFHDAIKAANQNEDIVLVLEKAAYDEWNRDGYNPSLFLIIPLRAVIP